MSAFRIVLRTHRFETAGVALFALATFGVAGGLIVRLLAYDIPVDCFGGMFTGGYGNVCTGRQLDIEDFLRTASGWGYVSLALIILLPVISGLFLGVALVGKEIDQGTTTFAWSVGPSRRRWLLQRAVPIGVLIVAASLGAGLLADWLELLRSPGVDPAQSFEHLGTRGGVVAAEALAFFGLALLVGSILGRVLPALLLSLALIAGSFVGVTLLSEAMLRTETVLVQGADFETSGPPPGRVVDYRVRTPDGVIRTWDEAYNIYGSVMETENGPPPDFKTIWLINPGQMYPLVVARMSVIFGAIGLASIVLAFAVVERRRP
jgi:ABC-type transport system involved in multi-copper enzyme maturation permease subunit